jgi:hypothetical protein
MNKDWKLAAGTVAVAAALAVPASATASLAGPAVAAAPLAACYQATDPHGVNIPVSLTGGGPGDGYVLAATIPGKGDGSAGSSNGNFDASGNAVTTLKDVFVPGDPIDPTAGRPIDLSVEDYNPASDTPVTTQLGTVTLSEAGLNVAFGNGKPLTKHKVTVANTAFAGKQLYGFITNKKGTVILRRWYLGRADPACGYAGAFEVVAPSKLVRGTYRLYVNAGSKLNKPASISEAFSITLY